MQLIQESIIEKASNFIAKHKGKLIAAALAGAGYYMYNHSNLDNNSTANHSNEATDDKTHVVSNTHQRKNGLTLAQTIALRRKMRREARERWDAAEKAWEKTGRNPLDIMKNA